MTGDSSSFDPTVPRRPVGRRTTKPPARPPDSGAPRPPGPPGSPDEGHTAPVASGRATRTATTDTVAHTAATDLSAGPGGFRFRLGDELGRGGMGTVRLAEDPDLQRELAVKFLQRTDPSSIEQFIEEAQITAQLEHPNIVPVHRLGRDDRGRPWLAMKRIEGESLADVIQRWTRTRPRGPLRPEELNRILALFGKICDALAFAHSRGVIHRDIKPANVMVGTFGEVLLVDWGLARPLGDDDDDDDERASEPRRDADTTADRAAAPVRTARRAGRPEITLEGDVFGTPAYMPPEQAQGRTNEVDERSDIFSLGGVLYHMLTLQPPYKGRTAASTVEQAARHELVPPRRRAPAHAIPKELQAIVLKAMAADSADRYSSVRELQADLAAWQSYRPTTAWRAGLPARAIKWTRRHPTATLTGALVLIAALIVAVLLSQLQAARDAATAARAREQLAEAQRLRAEEQRDVERQRADELGDLAMDRLSAESRAAIEAFSNLWNAAQAAGQTDDEFGATLSPADMERYLAAFNDLFRVHQLTGREPAAADHYRRALLRNFTGDRAGAIGDYDKLLRIEPGHRTARYNRGHTRQLLGDIDGAIADFDEVLRRLPTSQPALYNRGVCRLTRGDTGGAIDDFSALLDLDPRNVAAWCKRGDARQTRGDTAGALQDFGEALRVDPHHTDTLFFRGNLLAAQGDHAGALRDYTALLGLDPRHVRALMNRALVRQTQGDTDGALRDLGDLLAIEPQNARALANRGNVWQDRGQLDRALRDYEDALRLDETLWRAWLGRAFAIQTRDAAAMRESLQQAFRHCPHPADRDRIADFIRQAGGRVPD